MPLPKLAVQLMLGKKLREVTEYRGRLPVPLCFVKSPVFPFNKFPGVDPALGPEMRSTGEVMGVGNNFGEALAKAQLSAGTPLPDKGTIFISVNERYKPEVVPIAKRFAELGFDLVGTRGTAALLQSNGLKCRVVFKVNEGRPNAVDLLKGGAIQLVVYTTTGALSFEDEKQIRRAAITYRVPCITTMSGARAAVEAVASRQRDPIRVWSLQEIHGRPRSRNAGGRSRGALLTQSQPPGFLRVADPLGSVLPVLTHPGRSASRLERPSLGISATVAYVRIPARLEEPGDGPLFYAAGFCAGSTTISVRANANLRPVSSTIFTWHVYRPVASCASAA